jgi:hypothetical protein
MDFKKSNYVVESPVPTIGGNSKKVMFSTRRGMGIMLSDHVTGLVNDGKFDEIPSNIFNILMFHELIVPKDEVEVNEIKNRNVLLNKDDELKRIKLVVDIDRNKLDFPNVENIEQNLINGIDRGIKDFAICIVGKNEDYLRESSLKNLKYSIEERNEKARCKFTQVVIIGGNDTIDEFADIGESIVVILRSFECKTEEQFNSKIDFIQHLSGRAKHYTSIEVWLIIDGLSLSFLSNELGTLNKLNSLSNVRVKLSTHTILSEEKTEILLKVLQALSEKQSHFNLLPDPTLSSRGLFERSNSLVSLEFCDIYFKGDYYSVKKRSPFSTDYIHLLSKSGSRCLECIYLPMCGGTIVAEEDKNANYCPEFIEHIDKRIKLKYGISDLD